MHETHGAAERPGRGTAAATAVTAAAVAERDERPPREAAAATHESEPKAAEAPAANKAEVRELDFWYGDFHALKKISLPIVDREVTALIGPSGCGKSTFLRCFNRMHDLYPGNRYAGEIRLYPEGINIVDPRTDPMLPRLRIGMVFQKPNPFPKSIYENVASGLRIRGIRQKSFIDDRVELALKRAGLWKEVQERLGDSAYELSGGQQQRLCIA
ncbi:MAG TPA: ATP-binding cassette domain-containing protein, partial [Gemmatimonadales bacterium]|nr:ATP-binding cassette domain-containing protein [Gemmatimonadales bacterium]